MWPKMGLIDTNLSSPNAAYENARELARKAVEMERLNKGTKAAAIESLTRRGRFGSWLLKLHKGHSVSVHLHLYVRLVEIVENLAASTRKEADRIETMIAEIKGVSNEESECAASGRAGRDVAQSLEDGARAS